MAENVPQKNLFVYVDKLNSTTKWMVWIILFLSLIVLGFQNIEKLGLINFIECLLPILIIIEFIITLINSFYLIPKAERKRRYDALDNAFGSTYSLKNSKEYFTNDEVPIGVYKFGVNLFQNVFFTTRLSDKMMKGYIVKSSVFGVVFFIMAVYGLKNSLIILPILQFMFSATVFGSMIKFWFYHQENNRILDELKLAFQNSPSEVTILKEYLDYETNISWGQISLSDAFTEENNNTLEKEWQEIKIKFNLNGK